MLQGSLSLKLTMLRDIFVFKLTMLQDSPCHGIGCDWAHRADHATGQFAVLRGSLCLISPCFTAITMLQVELCLGSPCYRVH